MMEGSMPASAAELTAELTGERSSPMRMGMTFFIVSESALFGALFWTYYYLRAMTPAWPPHRPPATMAAVNTVLLLASSAALLRGVGAIRRGNARGLRASLAVTATLGAAFLGITCREWIRDGFRPWTDAYSSIFYTLTGFHALHVLGGVVLMLALLARAGRGRFSADNFVAVEAGSMYWHFVDVVWLAVFVTLFVVR